MKESERMSATKRSFIMEPSSNNNTGTEDEETMAFHRKRARRVSFADKEITSIHIFRPDDTSSSGTPPGSASSAQTAPTPELLGLFRDLAGDSDEDDLKSSSSPPSCDDAGVAGGRCSFLRPVGSPSPGGSSAATSTDDEDGFHGPVSAGFIRPERLSDSGVSDDLTMDSTAFSLHYRSLARSDSGDLKTPTRFRLFDEKTPSHTSSPPPATTGSFMVLTKVKKQFSQPVVPAEAASGCRDTSDMSIVLDNLPTYDYDKLPTELNRILAEGSNDFHAISPTLDSEAAISSPCIDGLVMVQGSIDLSMRSTEAPCNYGCSTSSQMDQLTRGLLDNKGDHTVADGSVHRIKTPDTSAKEIKEFVKDASVFVNKQLKFLNADEGRTPLKMAEENHLNVSVQSKHGHIVGQVRGSNPNDRGQVLNINEKDSEYKQIESFASLDERLLCSITRENNTCLDLINTNDHGIESIRNIMTLSQNEETVDTKNGEENFHLVSADSCNIKNSKPVEVTASPLQMTPLTRVRDCNLVDSMVENPKDDILSVMNQKLSLVDQRNCFGLLRQLDKQNESVDSGLGQDVEFNSEPAANIFGLSSYENSGKPSSDIGVAQLVKFAKETNESVKDSTVLVNKQSDLNGRTPLNMGERNQLNLPAQSEHGYSVGQVQTSNPEDRGQLPDISGRNSEYRQVETPNDSLEEQLLSITQENNMHQGLVSTDDHGIESSGNITMLSQNAETVGTEKCEENFNLISVDISCNAKNPKPLEITASPLQMTPLTRVRDCNIVDSMVENINNHILGVVNARTFSSSAKLLDQQLSQHVESQRNCSGELKQLVKQNEYVNCGLGLDAECNSEAAAQSVEKLLSIDGHKKDKLGRINRSPEVHKIGNSDLQLVAEPTSSIRGETAKLGYQTWKNLADIMEELFGGEQHLLSPSINKLNLRSICMLEDILGQLQKVKQCEILCSDIHPQKIIDPLHFSRHKRAVEARMLLLCLSYKKAKLQLMRVKHERLLEQVQHLSSGLQESTKLKFISCSSTREAVGTQSNDSHIQISLLNSEGTCQVIKMREELESFTSKAKSLSGFFHSFCKIETDQSCADVVESIRNYLQKKMSNKLIFQSLKLWAIEDFEVKDGGYIIVLNYGGYIIQRFKVSPRQPSLIISNNLNDVNIVKSFAGINAFSAFEFALNTHTTKKCFGSACLGQETQITSSHLSNLLDVVEEVQLSRIEIRNLVQAVFFSRSVEQLDLQLSFIDFCSGTNVKVTLDLTTCIKCGAYPVKVLPSQICGHANGVEHSLPSSLEYRIRAAAESVSVGYSRIIRLCRRISQAVESAT